MIFTVSWCVWGVESFNAEGAEDAELRRGLWLAAGAGIVGMQGCYLPHRRDKLRASPRSASGALYRIENRWLSLFFNRGFSRRGSPTRAGSMLFLPVGRISKWGQFHTGSNWSESEFRPTFRPSGVMVLTLSAACYATGLNPGHQQSRRYRYLLSPRK